MGEAGAAGARSGIERQGARFCSRRAGIRCQQRIPSAASHCAGNMQRAFDPGSHSDTAIRAGRNDLVFSRAGHTGAGTELGQPADDSAALRRAGVVLVDVPASGGDRTVLCRIPRPCEYVEPGWRGGQDRRKAWSPIVRPEKGIFPRTWIGNALLLACVSSLLPAVVISQESNVSRDLL